MGPGSIGTPNGLFGALSYGSWSYGKQHNYLSLLGIDAYSGVNTTGSLPAIVDVNVVSERATYNAGSFIPIYQSPGGPLSISSNTKVSLGNSVGISGTLAFIVGITFEYGVVWDEFDDSAIYFSFGSALGFDASIGVEWKQQMMNDRSPFKIANYQGYGSSNNLGFEFLDLIWGGDNDKYGDAASVLGYGFTYHEYGVGASFGIPVAYTRQFAHTWVFD